MYEFWPFWFFYMPFIPLWLYYSFKEKSWVYFSLANPNLKWGGFINYSKFKLLQPLEKKYLPKTNELIQLPYLKKMLLLDWDFPFVLKPDIGERGKDVQIILNTNDWEAYTQNKKGAFIVQSLITAPLEFGVFYVKNPSTEKSEILSITGKEFLTFKGNGKRTLSEFIQKEKRAFFRKEFLKEKYANQLNLILKKGEELLLEPIGNHNRGSLFYDASDLISPALTEKITKALNPLSHFYYGRVDLRTNSLADLEKGLFIVLEINAANSEATHIYDPNFTFWRAYKEVYRHLKVQHQIARINRKKGFKSPASISFFYAIFRFLFPK